MSRCASFVKENDGETLLDLMNEPSSDPSHIQSNTSATNTSHPMGINISSQANAPQVAPISTDTHNGGQTMGQRGSAAAIIKITQCPPSGLPSWNFYLVAGRKIQKKTAAVQNYFRDKKFVGNSS